MSKSKTNSNSNSNSNINININTNSLTCVDVCRIGFLTVIKSNSSSMSTTQQ